MAMDNNQRYNYDSYMRDGDWHMSAAETNLGYNYFSQARNHYWNAAECYKKAAQIAHDAGDYAEGAAYSKQCQAEREFSEVLYKEQRYRDEHCR